MEKNIKKDLEQYGRELVLMMRYLTLPDEFIKSMVTMLDDLSIEQIETLYTSLKDASIEKLAVEADKEYQEEADKIDHQTRAEINQIINA